jgi:hypothetical protein
MKRAWRRLSMCHVEPAGRNALTIERIGFAAARQVTYPI